MQSTARITISIFLLTSALVSAYPYVPWGKLFSFTDNSAKLRRDGVLNLYPFPRVGRAGPRTWQVPVNDFYLEDYEPMEKRQLYAFPRVGRADTALRELFHPDQLQSVPVRRADSPGMWFGPRLGRAVKSNDDGDLTHQEHIRDAASQNNNEIGMWFGPRVGRSAKTDDNGFIQNDSSDRSEPEQVDVHPMERKKRQARPL